jgi:hypothetical protein
LPRDTEAFRDAVVCQGLGGLGGVTGGEVAAGALVDVSAAKEAWTITLRASAHLKNL